MLKSVSNARRNNLAELVIKEAAAENGDTVVIDFVGSIDGVEFDGGKVKTSPTWTWFRSIHPWFRRPIGRSLSWWKLLMLS